MHGERRVQSYLADLVFSHNLAPLRLCGRISLSDWDREEKPASLTDLAFKPDLAAVHLHEFLRQRKAQAGALRFSRVSARLLKFEEDPFLVFWRDSWSRITHLDTHGPVFTVRPHPYPSPFGGEFDRVSYEVQKHLLNSGSVHGKWLRHSNALDMKGDGFFGCQRPHRIPHRLENIAQQRGL